MRIITKQINIYKFNELQEDIKEELIQHKLEQIKSDYIDYYLESDMKHEAELLLNDYFNNAKLNNVLYDLWYCQGSGSMIEFSIELEDLNKKYKILSEADLKYATKNDLIDNIKIVHYDYNKYYHEYAFDIKYDLNSIDTKRAIKIKNLLTDLLSSYQITQSVFIQDMINMNKKLTKIGYELIEQASYDKDYAIELLEENEYLENGEVYYE